MINPFCDSLEIARKVLFNDPNVLFRYRKMPKGALAGFLPPDKANGRPFPEIHLPAANTSRFTKPEQVMYSALMGHEFLHYNRSIWDIGTIFNTWEKEGKDITIKLAKCLEDVRIESGPTIGEGISQDIHIFRLTEYNRISDLTKQEKINAPFGWVMAALQYHYFKIGSISVDEGYQKYFDIAVEILDKNDAFIKTYSAKKEGNKTLLKLCEEITKAWAEEKNDNDEQKNKDDNKKSGEDKKDDDGKDNEGDQSGQDNTESDPHGEESNSDKKIKNLNDDFIKEDESPIDDDLLKKLVQDMVGECSEETQEELRQISKTIDPSSPVIQKEFDPNQNIYIPYSMDDKICYAPENKKEYEKMKSEIGSKIVIMKSSLSKILVSKSQRQTNYFQKRGKINPGHLYRVVTDKNPNIRVKTKMEEDFNTGVSLLIDLSGSMSGGKVQTAARVAMTFAEALQSVPMIKFEILGYNCQGQNILSNISHSDFNRTEKINHWIFKSFNEPWGLVSSRIGSVNDSLNKNGCVGGCNIDHENLNLAAKRLFDQNVHKRILIVICDGIPNGGYGGGYNHLLEDELKAVIKKIRKHNIKLFCFGINSEKVKKFYEPEVLILQNIEDLNKVALNQLAKYMLD